MSHPVEAGKDLWLVIHVVSRFILSSLLLGTKLGFENMSEFTFCDK